MNEKLIRVITNCKFNELIKKLLEEMKISDTDHPFEPSDILSFLSHIDSKYSLEE